MFTRFLSSSLAALMFTATPALAHSGQDYDERDRSHVRPSDGTQAIVVDNDVGRAITVYADGRQVEVVKAGDSARVRIDRDTRKLEARVGTRRVARLNPDGRDRVWRIERPTETGVLVKNPLPIDVVITLDGVTRTLQAGATGVFDEVSVGTNTFVARRVSGQVIDRDTVSLSAFADFRWEIDPPVQGLVSVQNRWSTPLEVELNGKVVAVLKPGQSRTFKVRCGRTSVELTRMSRSGRRGAEVVDTMVRIDRYETERLVTGPASRSRHHVHGAAHSAR